MFSASVSVWTQMEISLKQVLHTDITQFSQHFRNPSVY